MWETIVEFLVAPYEGTAAYLIVLEAIAVMFGIASVYYAKQENILVYPTGIVSTLIYVYILALGAFFGDMMINGYYTIMSVYGWIVWSRVGTDHLPLPVTWTTRREQWIALGLFVITAGVVYVVYQGYGKFGHWYDYVDMFTTGIFFAGMWLMARKKIENWHLWIIGDLVSIPLYYVKGYGISMLQYVVFLVLAWQGLQAWKRSYAKQTSPN